MLLSYCAYGTIKSMQGGRLYTEYAQPPGGGDQVLRCPLQPDQSGKAQPGRGGRHPAGTRYIYDTMETLVMTVDPLGNVRSTSRDIERGT